MAKPKIAVNPKHPEPICWGCDKLCPANDLCCGSGTIRTQHPVELFGEDWMEWELDDQGAEREPCCVVLVFDTAGLALFAGAAAGKAQAFHAGPIAAMLLGMLTGIGGGMVRDVLVKEISTVYAQSFMRWRP